MNKPRPPKLPVFNAQQKQHILDGMAWFKKTFGAQIQQGIQALPFSLDFLTAIAVQETFEVWGRLFAATPAKPLADILMICVGDPLDLVDGRGARSWPADRAALEAWAPPQGQQMFQIAHQALVGLSQVAPEYATWANNPDKFCHAYGIFQYDIGAFKTDAGYFLNKRWGDFALCLTKCLGELIDVKAQYYPNATTLTDTQLVYLAIAYNAGSVNLNGDFNQGYQDSDDVYYGQYINTFLGFAKSTLPAG
jgi:hypothetical protein